MAWFSAGDETIDTLRARAEAAEAEVEILKKRIEELELREKIRPTRGSRDELGCGPGRLPRVESGGTLEDDEGFLPMRRYRSTAADGKPDAIVIVDPISTGAALSP